MGQTRSLEEPCALKHDLKLLPTVERAISDQNVIKAQLLQKAREIKNSLELIRVTNTRPHICCCRQHYTFPAVNMTSIRNYLMNRQKTGDICRKEKEKEMLLEPRKKLQLNVSFDTPHR